MSPMMGAKIFYTLSKIGFSAPSYNSGVLMFKYDFTTGKGEDEGSTAIVVSTLPKTVGISLPKEVTTRAVLTFSCLPFYV